MNDSDPPKPKRRWYQLSLWTLLLLVCLLLITLPVGWFCLERQRERRHQRQLDQISLEVGQIRQELDRLRQEQDWERRQESIMVHPTKARAHLKIAWTWRSFRELRRSIPSRRDCHVHESVVPCVWGSRLPISEN